MSSMDKMWLSLIAIGMMAFASLIVSFARARTKGIIRILLSFVAALILVITVPFALLSML